MFWLRKGLDSNQRSLAYEASEMTTSLPRNNCPGLCLRPPEDLVHEQLPTSRNWLFCFQVPHKLATDHPLEGYPCRAVCDARENRISSVSKFSKNVEVYHLMYPIYTTY